MQTDLGKIELVSVEENLVDAIWADRPEISLSDIIKLEEKYSGRSVENKLQWLRGELKKENCRTLLITALDEIACIGFCFGTCTYTNT